MKRIMFLVSLIALILLPGTTLFSQSQEQAASPKESEVKLKEISYIQGFRENQLSGIGVVTGLAGKGDSQSSAMMRKFLANIVSNYTDQVSEQDVRSKNSAVVLLTADIPAYVQPGERVSIQISSLGDAKSLSGGVLLQSPLQGADGIVYAAAQGVIPASEESINNTVALLPGGAIIEKAVNSRIMEDNRVTIILKEPDYTAAAKISEIIESETGFEISFADASRIGVMVPEEYQTRSVAFIAMLENLNVPALFADKVVINPRTGVVVMGQDVRIGKVAVSYKGLKISVGMDGGFTDKESESFLIEDRPSVEQFVDLLREIGVDTKGLIEILQAVDHAGALFGKLEVM